MIDLQLERIMPDIERRVAPKFVANLRRWTIIQNNISLDPIRTNIKDVGIRITYVILGKSAQAT